MLVWVCFWVLCPVLLLCCGDRPTPSGLLAAAGLKCGERDSSGVLSLSLFFFFFFKMELLKKELWNLAFWSSSRVPRVEDGTVLGPGSESSLTLPPPQPQCLSRQQTLPFLGRHSPGLSLSLHRCCPGCLISCPDSAASLLLILHTHSGPLIPSFTGQPKLHLQNPGRDQVEWLPPVIPAPGEAEVGRWLELRSSRPAWTT